MLSVEEIKKILPHRYPFLLVDRVIDFEKNNWIKTLKNVTANEPFFVGHFPQASVMPGVLVVEAMAQSGGILAFLSMDENEFKKSMGGRRMVYFMGIEKARFKKTVVPGDQLIMKVEIIVHKMDVWKLHGVAHVEGKLVAEATMAAKIDKGIH